MSRSRPATTGYERLAQADVLSDDSDDDVLSRSYASLQPASAPRFAPISQPHPLSGMASPKNSGGNHGGRAFRRPQRRRLGSTSGVDLKAINARLERWADEITARFKRRRSKNGHDEEDERLEILHSVFQAPDGVRPITAEGLAAPQPVMSAEQFDGIVESVRDAIEQDVHPSMISQGSSGSYFARNPEGKVVGVFKPKDEEPYAAGNPKWNKWIHRNLFPCCFGRACLIPNLSYVSEAAAYTLDSQLRTHIVPYTDVVCLASPAFHYPFWDRRSFSKKKKLLPAKPGSFQVFLKGFKDANLFLRENPWPDQYWSGYRADRRRRRRRWADSCRPSTAASQEDAYSDDNEPEARPEPAAPGPNNFLWTETLKQSFREELEKLVILDYMMRNTDRGLDNWMIKVDWESQQVSVASEPIQLNMDTAEEQQRGPRPVELVATEHSRQTASLPYRAQRPMQASTPAPRDAAISIGAIDNSLSWPWKHPDAWRSFPFGWLFLPVGLIGRPFSQKTRDHFLPLLTSTAWWCETQLALRRVFTKDPDFQEGMFSKQMAVMKGQAWNVVETLKMSDHGPLELTRRAKVCVWDDLVDVPIAVPMRVSSDVRTHNAERRPSIDEIDIGTSASASASASAAPVTRILAVDALLGAAAPPADMPHPGRFERSIPAAVDSARFPEDYVSFAPRDDEPLAASSAAQACQQPTRQQAPRSHSGQPSSSRVGFAQTPSRPHRPHSRRGSFAASLRSGGRSIAQPLYDSPDPNADDFDGDLGYAAAEDMEGNHRKAIVERLEAVKSRNPVFTCW